MRDVIGRVIEAEAEAKRILAAAQTEADRILAEARKTAEERSAQIHQDTQAQAATVKEAILQTAQNEKQGRLAQITDGFDTQLHLDEPTRQNAVASAIKQITN